MAPRPVGSGRTARDLLLSGRADSLTNEALISLVVGGPGSAGLGETILCEHPVSDGLWRVGTEELTRHSGIGPATAARILASLEIGRRSGVWRAPTRPTVSAPEDVVALCGPQLRGLDREHFWALPLNTKNQLIRLVEVSIGSLNASIVHPRELFKEAVRLSAASIVVVHNHPSGDPTPSGADLQLTTRLVKAGDVLGIELLDHVILGDGGKFESLRDLGVM